MNTRKFFIILLIFIFLVLSLVSIILLAGIKKDRIKDKINTPTAQQDLASTPWQCLKEDEEAGYYDKLGEFSQTWVAREYPLKVIVRDKNTKKEIRSIVINSVMESYHPAEVFSCGIYVMVGTNYDPKKTKQNIGYKDELYKFDYSGNKEKLVLLSEKPKEFISYYSLDFRVSPNEKYVALIKSYGGQADYSLVIKDLETKEDVFSLKMNNFINKYPDIEGSFDMVDWKLDGRYFWADIMNGAPVSGYLRVDSRDWSYDAWVAPPRALGGFVPNYTTGWMPYAPSAVWTGMVEMDEAVREEARVNKQTSPLYIYNLFTKQKIKITDTDIDPIWNWGPPEWISNKTLKYKLPNGEEKQYNLK